MMVNNITDEEDFLSRCRPRALARGPNKLTDLPHSLAQGYLP